MNFQILPFIFLMIFSSGSIAQPPYFFNKKTDPGILAGAVVLFGAGYYFSSQTLPLTEREITALDLNNINRLDRFATKNYSPKQGKISDGLLAGAFILPGPLIFNKRIQKDFWPLASMYNQAFWITTGATLLTKAGTTRPRPFVYNPEVGLLKKTNGRARHSFFSGHTALASMNAFFFAKLYSDYFPESRFRPYVWTAAVLLPAATAYARVEAGKHFPTDVAAGFATGALIGYFVPFFHKKENELPAEISLDILPNRIGIYLSLN